MLYSHTKIKQNLPHVRALFILFFVRTCSFLNPEDFMSPPNLNSEYFLLVHVNIHYLFESC